MFDNQQKYYFKMPLRVNGSKENLRHKSISEAYYQISENQRTTLPTEHTDTCLVLFVKI